MTAAVNSLPDAHDTPRAADDVLAHLLRSLWATSRQQPSLKDHALVLADRIGVFEQARRARRSGPARVACIGRTMSGKSTLRYALTGEGEAGIGRGGQRTTTENIEYRWCDVVVVDTPGVGAHKGSADEVLADLAVRDADAAVWVTSTDGVQLATAGPIRRFLASGIPFVVVVNHRRALRADEATVLRDDALIRDVAEHEDRIRQVLSGLDVMPRAFVHTQLHLARLGRSAADDVLLARSGIHRLEHGVASLAEAAVDERETSRSRRVRAEARRTLQALARLSQSLAELRTAVDHELDTAEHTARDALQHLTAESAKTLQSHRRSARSRLTSAARAAKEQENLGKAQDALQTAAQSLLDQHLKDARDVLTACRQEVADAFTCSEPKARAAQLRRSDVGKLDLTLDGDPQWARTVRTAAQVATGLTALPVTPFVLLRLVAQPFLQAGISAITPSVEEQQDKRRRSAGRAQAIILDVIIQQHDAASRALETILATSKDAADAQLKPLKQQQQRLRSLQRAAQAATDTLEELLA